MEVMGGEIWFLAHVTLFRHCNRGPLGPLAATEMLRVRKFLGALRFRELDSDTLGLVGLATEAVVEAAVTLSRKSIEDRERQCPWDPTYSSRGGERGGGRGETGQTFGHRFPDAQPASPRALRAAAFSSS